MSASIVLAAWKAEAGGSLGLWSSDQSGQHSETPFQKQKMKVLESMRNFQWQICTSLKRGNRKTSQVFPNSKGARSVVSINLKLFCDIMCQVCWLGAQQCNVVTPGVSC